MIRFVLDGEIEVVDGIAPTATVLDWLRYTKGRTGSKEGCAEGDCGACTVLVGELPRSSSEAVAHRNGGRIKWRTVNACILFMPMLHGRALMTVESLARDGALHPVQQAMVDLHGSQCGFCTPGIVMSLCGRAMGACGTNCAPRDVLAGNLCRCTGYGPILAAAEAVPLVDFDDAPVVATLATISDESLALDFAGNATEPAQKAWSPRSIDELAALYKAHPEARIVAGATDVGLWVTKQHRHLPEVIFVGDVAGFAALSEDEAGLTIGAGVRYSDALDALSRLAPDLGELVRRIGAVQVRNSGTIGGNIANGSPIGDMPPALIALSARLTLRQGTTRREMALEDFFIAYGKQDRAPGEFVESIFVPRPQAQHFVRIVKLSKRFDSDISAVCAAINLAVEDGVITAARIAFGGMAATPKRATACETALVGKPWKSAAFESAAEALKADFQPLSDVRGSADYRLTVAGNVLRRMWHGTETVLDVEAIDA